MKINAEERVSRGGDNTMSGEPNLHAVPSGQNGHYHSNGYFLGEHRTPLTTPSRRTQDGMARESLFFFLFLFRFFSLFFFLFINQS